MVSASPEAHAEPLSAANQVAITQVVTGVGLYTDVRDWRRVSSLMADHVTTNYTDIFGGQIVSTSREDLVAQWRNTFEGFDATQHQITNVSVSGGGDEASTCHTSARSTGSRQEPGRSAACTPTAWCVDRTAGRSYSWRFSACTRKAIEACSTPLAADEPLRNLLEREMLPVESIGLVHIGEKVLSLGDLVVADSKEQRIQLVDLGARADVGPAPMEVDDEIVLALEEEGLAAAS